MSFGIGDHVMCNSGPYALNHGVVEEVPKGLQHPLVRVRFFGKSGNLMSTKTDLVNVNRLVSFGALLSKDEMQALEKARKAERKARA